jgi:hypothetical protein
LAKAGVNTLANKTSSYARLRQYFSVVRKPALIIYMKKILLLIHLFASVSLYAQTASTDTAQLSTIIRSSYSIAHPNTWSVDTSKTFGMDLLLRSPKSDSLDDFYENVNVFVQDLKGQGYTLMKMGLQSESQIKSLVTDVVIVESQVDSSGTEPFYRLSYKGRQGKFALTTLQRYYLKNEIGYAVTLTLITKVEDQYRAIGEKMFASFKIR